MRSAKEVRLVGALLAAIVPLAAGHSQPPSPTPSPSASPTASPSPTPPPSPSPTPSPSPSPAPSPSPTPIPIEELIVRLDTRTHLVFGPDRIPKWFVKQNNQLDPGAFKCIVEVFPAQARPRLVLDVVPAASPSPAPAPPTAEAQRLERSGDALPVTVKRSELASDGLFKVRASVINGPVVYTRAFLLELR